MNDCEIIAEFVTESREHLADIENQLLGIEAAGVAADPELVNTVFRAVHSIKGAAGFLGFSTVGRLAHDLENVLNLVRNQQLVPNATVTDVLLRSADKLRGLIENIDHSNAADVSEYLGELQRVVAGVLAEEVPEPSSPVLVSSEARSSEDSEGAPWDGDGSNEPIAGWDSPAAPLSAIEPVARQSEPAARPAAQGTRIPKSQAGCAAERPEAASPSAATAATASSHVESSIRVAVNVLDRLMTLAGELVLARNQLIQTASRGDQAAWGSVAARVNQVTSELQETIMQTRLQPIGTVFGRFPRVIRDLSGTLGKQCQLTIEGQDVELDKSIIESIGDPLTHLVRNAVDHGIESPEVRVKSGKQAAGHVAMRAFHQAGKVNIQISDDGRGIDVARLKDKAVAKGLVTAEQARGMSDREALQLIFRAGFSLAEQVTAVSGRGVGMDVVKTNIERLGGTVTVETQPSQGTTIHVKLPLTLAIIPSLVVRCAGRRYAIPQASIRELVRIRASEAGKRIEKVKCAEVLRLRGTLLPLVRLGAALHGESAKDPAAPAQAVNIIVVEAGHLR